MTLEPCSHHGRTPPCADALVAAGVGRVVYAMRDPNPQVDGGGIARLAAAGIAVEGGVLEREALELNPGFVSRMTRGRPWVSVKLAASLDGATALPGGESQWITGEAARDDVQRLRARSSAVMTGSGTVLADDPRLDVRLPGTVRQPLRVVLDSQLRTPPGARILAPPGQALILCSERRPGARRAAARRRRRGSGGGRVLGRRRPGGGTGHARGRGRSTSCWSSAGQASPARCFPRASPTSCSCTSRRRCSGRGARPLADLESPASLAGRLQFSIVERQDVGGDLLLRLRPRH